MSRIVSLSRAGQPSIGRIAPWSRIVPGMGAVRWRSEAPTDTA